MKKILFIVLLLFGLFSESVQAQILGETEDVSFPQLFNFALSTEQGRSANCTGGCTGPDDFSYTCGYLLGCQVGYEDGQNDANQCFREFGFVDVFGPDNFKYGYQDGWYNSYDIGYNDRIAEKSVECSSQSTSVTTFEFDDFSCDCNCIKNQYLFDGDGDNYYDPNILFKLECSPPSPAWKLANTFFGTDCNDNDPLVFKYNECGLCTFGEGITTWYFDGDEDGYYGQTLSNCNRPTAGGETKWSSNPGAGEDCDDEDADANISKTWYFYGDADNYYGLTEESCTRPTSGNPAKWKITPDAGADCDDSNPNVIGETNWYYDFDGDGYYSRTFFGCGHPEEGEPSKWSTEEGNGKSDCDDTNAEIFKRGGCGVCGGNGTPIKVYWDFDQDGYYGFEMADFCDSGDRNNYSVNFSNPDSLSIIFEGSYVNRVAILSIDYLIELGYPEEAFNREIPAEIEFSGERRTADDTTGYMTYSSIGISIERLAGYRTTSRVTNTHPFNPPYDFYLHTRGQNLVKQYIYTDPLDYIIFATQTVGATLHSTTAGLGLDCNDLNPNIKADGTWYADRDEDGFHDPDFPPLVGTCSPPDNGWILLANSQGEDCDDTDQFANAPKTWYYDNDLDNFYSSTRTSCLNPGKGTDEEEKWQSDPGFGEDCNDEDIDATLPVTWYKDADGDNYYSLTDSTCINPGTATGERALWNTDPGLGEDCDDTATEKSTINACGECGGSDDPIDFYLDLDSDGYHSLHKKADCGLNVFDGETVRNNPNFPTSLKIDTATVVGDGITGTIPNTTLAYSYNKITDQYFFPDVLLTPNTLGIDCDDLDSDQKADGAWYPDFDRDGYHDLNASAIIGCTPPGENYLLLTNSLGPDCDDGDFKYNVVKTWYRDEDGDGYFVDVQKNCHDPGWGWALTSNKGPDDNDGNPFSPTNDPNEEEFFLPALIEETTDEIGNPVISYGGQLYHPDSLKILYRGITLKYNQLIYDRLDPDTLLDDTNLVLQYEDVLYGAQITGSPISEGELAARGIRTILSQKDTIEQRERFETEWIAATIKRNEGFTHAFGDLKPEGEQAIAYFAEACDPTVFRNGLKAHYDRFGHPPFAIAYKSSEEQLKISLDGSQDETIYAPLIDEQIGEGPIGARIEVLKNIFGRIEYVVSINDQVFKATPTQLANHDWLDENGNPTEKLDAAGNWLDPADEQIYNEQVGKGVLSRQRMVNALAVDFETIVLNKPTPPESVDLPQEKYPNYDFRQFGWWFKITETLEVGHHLWTEFEMPKGIWDPKAPNEEYEKLRTKSPASVAGIVDRGMQEIADMAEMVELAESLTKKDTWEGILESLKNFNIDEMVSGLITEGRAQIATLQGDSGVHKQYHAVGKLTAGTILTIYSSWKTIGKLGRRVITGTKNAAKKVNKRFGDFRDSFNKGPNKRITKSPEFRNLDADQQKRLTRQMADDPDNKLRDALAEDPELTNSWERLDNLGRNQMSNDPDILKSFKKTLDNPDIPSNRLDNIINSLAKSGANCKTCTNPGKKGLRFVNDILDDLDGFAKEFKAIDGYDSFLKEMGESGRKATGGSWSLEGLMRNRKKYFDNETITGFEVKHVPGRDFAADVVTDIQEFTRYKEFKSWSSNLLSTSNTIEQMTGTMSTITRLEDMQFIFNPSRWKPSASQLRMALQSKKNLIDAVSSAKKTQLFGTTNTDEIIDILSNQEVFETIIKVQ